LWSREPGDHPDAAPPLSLELGQRDVRRRLDQPSEVGFLWLEQRQAMLTVAAGAALPVARTRCTSLIAAAGLTAMRCAAWRIEPPLSAARTMCVRRSNEIGAGIAAIPAHLNRYC